LQQKTESGLNSGGIAAAFGGPCASMLCIDRRRQNIDHVTRMMTTAIALETTKGDLALALGLGIILIVLAPGVDGEAFVIRDLTRRPA
jgi:tungstate transport system permease protein